MAVTTFRIHWDCPECCESDSGSGSGSSSSSSGSGSSSSSSGSGSSSSSSCDYCILQISVHVTRDADPTIGVDALDEFITGYVPSCWFSIGDSVYNSEFFDCNCTIDAISQTLCFSTYNDYLAYWNSINQGDKWQA